MEHAVVIAEKGGVGHVLGVNPSRLGRAIGPIAKFSALDIVAPPNGGGLHDLGIVEQARPQHRTQQPHWRVGAVATLEAGIVGVGRTTTFDRNHEVHIHTLWLDDLCVVELLGRFDITDVLQEKVRAFSSEGVVHPVVLEPQRTSALRWVGTRAVPTPERRIRSLRFK